MLIYQSLHLVSIPVHVNLEYMGGNETNLREDIIVELTSFFTSQLADGTPVMPSSTLESLGVDSFFLLETVLHLERCFGSKFPLHLLTPENAKDISTLAKCYAATCSEDE